MLIGNTTQSQKFTNASWQTRKMLDPFATLRIFSTGIQDDNEKLVDDSKELRMERSFAHFYQPLPSRSLYRQSSPKRRRLWLGPKRAKHPGLRVQIPNTASEFLTIQLIPSVRHASHST